MMTAIKDRRIILLQPDGEPPCRSDSSEACPSLCQDCQGQGISPQELRNPIPSQFPIGQLIFSQLLKLIQLINVAHISSLCKLYWYQKRVDLCSLRESLVQVAQLEPDQEDRWLPPTPPTSTIAAPIICGQGLPSLATYHLR